MDLKGSLYMENKQNMENIENKQMLFTDLALDNRVQETLATMGFTHPTPIQAQAIPQLLDEVVPDFHGQAQTGTGKTLAFGLPLLQRIDTSSKATQSLIVAPTRELAGQICSSLEPFARALGISITTIYGGMSMETQVRALRRGVQIVVGTPGRINDHLRRGNMDLKDLEVLVLDEADIMLDMGFKEEIDEILSFTPKNRKIWLFSATVKEGIANLMKRHMHETASVRVSRSKVGSSSTKQYYCVVPSRHRVNALARFVESAPDFYGFIFCQTKLLTSEVADRLTRRSYKVGALHGDMSQAQRNSVIKKFKERQYDIVVATDVAARGIDVQDLTHVINFSLPEDLESYVHRVGRTGRAGKEGTAITFISPRETRAISSLQRKFGVKIEENKIPSRDDIVASRLQSLNEKIADYASSTQSGEGYDKVVDLVADYSSEQLQTILAQMLYNKHVKAIMQEGEMVFTPARAGAPSQELVISVGADDGIDRSAVINFIVDSSSINRKSIQKVRVIRRKTFIEVPVAEAEQLFKGLKGATLGGRRTRVQFVEESSDNDARRSRGSRRPGGGGGDRRRRSSSPRRR